MRSVAVTLSLAFCFAACTAEAVAPDPLEPPLGLQSAQLVAPLVPNELTVAKAELGKKLFFDPRLSASGKMGCVNCHYPDKAFTDGVAHSVKDNGKKNSRNSPTMFNVGYYPALYWDGRTVGLESNGWAAWTGQLGGDPAEVAGRLNKIAAYKAEFEAAFGKAADEDTIVQALSSFLRTLRSGNSAYDRHQAGDESAMSEAAKAGLGLFSGKAGCVTCHVPPLFTTMQYHNLGIGMKAESPDIGRAKPSKDASKTGAFKTPTLREVAHTAPYFHDGSVATLTEAVTLVAGGGIDNPHKDPLMTNRNLSEAEIGQLVAFLEALSGDVDWRAPVLPK